MAYRLPAPFLAALLIGVASCTYDPAAQQDFIAAPADTTAAGRLIERVEQFYRAAQFDSALVYLDRARLEYEAHGDWAGVVRSYSAMGDLTRKMARFERSAEHLEQALEMARNYLREDDPALGDVYDKLGVLRANLSKYANALELHQRALDLKLAAYGEEHVDVAETYHNLGTVYMATADFGRAGDFFAKALRIRKAAWGEEHPQVAETYAGIGRLHLELGKYDLALSHLEKALELSRSAFGNAHPEGAIVLNGLGNVYRLLDDYRRALSVLRESLDIATATLDEKHPIVAVGLNNLAIVHVRTGDYANARSHFERSLEIYIDLFGEMHREVARVRVNLAELFREQGNPGESIELVVRALAIQRSLFGDAHIDVASAYFQLGVAYRVQGDYLRALDLVRKSLEIRRLMFGEEHRLVAATLSQIAVLHWDIGNYDLAIEYIEGALNIDLSLDASEPLDLYLRYSTLGVAYLGMGDYVRSIEMLEFALQIASSIENRPDRIVAIGLNNLGSVYQNVGDLDRARELFIESLELFILAHGELHPDVANQYNKVGSVIRMLGDPREAIKHHEKALQIYEATSGQGHPYVGWVYSQLGASFESLHEGDRALDAHKEALRHGISIFGDRHPRIATIHNDIGGLYEREGRFERALTAYGAAMISNSFGSEAMPQSPSPLARVLSEPEWLNSLWGKARALTVRPGLHEQKILNLEAAVETYFEATLSIDRMRKSFQTPAPHLHRAGVEAPLLADAVRTSLQLYELTADEAHKAAAFFFAEKSKAGLLLGAFYESRAREFAGIPDSLLEEERRVLSEIKAIDRRLAGAGTASTVLTAGAEQAERTALVLWRRHEDLIRHFEEAYPDYYNLKYNVEVATPDQIQAGILDENTALVEYVVGDRDVFIFTITPRSLDVATVHRDSLLDHHVSELRRGIVEQDFDAYADHARLLYRQLLEPVVDKLHVDRLVIVPDGVLYYVPFEALLTEDIAGASSRRDYRELPYLIDRFTVSYAYSATLLLETQRRERAEPVRDYVAFAPVFAGGLPAGSRGAEMLRANGKMDEERSPLFVPGYLPMTRTEVTGIRRLFTRQYGMFERLFTRKARVYLEEEARKARVQSPELAEYRYVHFATHGFANETDPDASGIILYPETRSATAGALEARSVREAHVVDDGVLRLDEVYNLSLSAELVVLSACETGLGPIARGEGVLSLTRGFLYAGASRVLVSLWQVDDSRTGELMLGFYGNMLSGSTKPEALRDAKLDLIRGNPRYARPYYWAPFVLMGT